jgi:peptide/nickel transport system permease protein
MKNPQVSTATPVASAITPSLPIEGVPLQRALGEKSSGINGNRWSWLRTLSPLHWLLLGVLAVIVISAVFAGTIAPHDPELNDLRARLRPPAWEAGGSTDHLLGTDQLGRDIFSRVIYGARISLSIAVLGTLAGSVVGALCGLVSGFRRGAIDETVMLVVDALMSLPFIVVALAVIAMLGSSFGVLIFLAALSGFAGYTRIARGLAMQVTNEQYVLAAQSIGVSPVRVLLRHALPNMLAPMIVLATMEMASIILLEASLSFLGFGVQPPTPSWGQMVSDGRQYLNDSWWVGVPPGIAIMVVAMCISLLGDWLRDLLDPTTGK